MKLTIGTYYINNTWKFLLPCLSGHGEVATARLNQVFKMGVGIHDMLTDGSPFCKRRSIYVMIDLKHRPTVTKQVIDWFEEQSYCIGGYCPDSELKNSRKYMLVLEIPEQFHHAYDMFLQGKYSQMFTREDMQLLFKSDNRKKDLKILTKDPLLKEEFLAKVNHLFEANYTGEYSGELELPLEKEKEIFNYKPSNTIYFNEKIDKIWQNS